MKLIYAPLLLLPLLLCSSVVRAADWVPVAVAGSENQYFYDRSKLNIKDDEIKYWQKVVYHAPQNVQGGEAASALLRERIDCAGHTAKRLNYLYYSEAGETLEHVARDESEPVPIIPDTAGDAFEQALCPHVWQKQEELRIKAEQKTADSRPAEVSKQNKKDVADSPGEANAEQAPQKTEPASLPQAMEQLY
ncbi:MAG TPA: hypothetical protein PLH03_01290 [Methylophilaceae bacterium]|nr:hypothetical protein [Methylophilaceae bacterium]